MPAPTSRRASPSLVLAALLALVPAVRAGDPEPLVYGLNAVGTLTVNGTVLDKLPSSYDLDSGTNFYQQWVRLAVEDDEETGLSNRYALRLDGELYRNGKKYEDLFFNVVGSALPTWVGLSVDDGVVYALRQDGLLNGNGIYLDNLPAGIFFYTNCLAVGPNVYSLRSDGTVYRNIETSAPYLKFTGGPGIDADADGAGPDSGINNGPEGIASEAIWIALGWDPQEQQLWGLRQDGTLSSGLPPGGPGDGEPVEQIYEFPFPSTASSLYSSTGKNNFRYRALGVTEGGTLYVLSGSGKIYTTASVLEAFVDLPPDGNSTLDETYTSLVVQGSDFWTIRWDGNVYENTTMSPTLSLTSSGYRSVDLSLLPPDLSNFKNPKPLLEYYSATVVDGSAFSVPVYATDIEKVGPQLDVYAGEVSEKKPLPPGLMFNPDPDMDPITPPTVSWDVATPKGSYSVPVVVSDGVNKPKTYKYKVKVILPDTNPLKNKKPVFTKVKNTQALVGFDYRLDMFAVDADEGDTVTLSVDTTKEPFATLGAQFLADPGTGTGVFLWSPTFDDIGKWKVKVTATDSALATKTYTVTIKVVNSLIFSTPF